MKARGAGGHPEDIYYAPARFVAGSWRGNWIDGYSRHFVIGIKPDLPSGGKPRRKSFPALVQTIVFLGDCFQSSYACQRRRSCSSGEPQRRRIPARRIGPHQLGTRGRNLRLMKTAHLVWSCNLGMDGRTLRGALPLSSWPIASSPGGLRRRRNSRGHWKTTSGCLILFT